MDPHASSAPAARFGVVYDFRNPRDSGISNPDLYQHVLRQVAWLDGLGLDQVWFTEHHFVDDGYLPAWIPVASAMAALTKHVRFSTDICLLPFNNPVRLAEDLAVLDNISNGRVEVGFGMGYVPDEFKGFGLPVSRRLSLMEEGLDVLKLCFSGECFDYHGKRYHFDGVRITPEYVQAGGPPIWLAATTHASASRAARYATHLLPQGGCEKTIVPYRQQMRAKGLDPQHYRAGIIRGCFVTDDEERDWPRIKESERYRMRLYSRFSQEAGRNIWSGEDIIPQQWIVGDVASCVRQLYDFMRQYGITDVVTWGIPPSIKMDQMSASLEAFATQVVPQVRALLEQE